MPFNLDSFTDDAVCPRGISSRKKRKEKKSNVRKKERILTPAIVFEEQQLLRFLLAPIIWRRLRSSIMEMTLCLLNDTPATVYQGVCEERDKGWPLRRSGSRRGSQCSSCSKTPLLNSSAPCHLYHPHKLVICFPLCRLWGSFVHIISADATCGVYGCNFWPENSWPLTRRHATDRSGRVCLAAYVKSPVRGPPTACLFTPRRVLRRRGRLQKMVAAAATL